MAVEKEEKELWKDSKLLNLHLSLTKKEKSEMKRPGQRIRKNKSRPLNPEFEVHKAKFQNKKLKNQQEEIDEQWKKIQELQSSDTDL